MTIHPLRSEPGSATQPDDALRTSGAAATDAPVTVCGRQAALSWQSVPVAAAAAETGPSLSTVVIAGAHASGGTGFDWAHKVTFACALRELPLLLAVLLGWRDRAEFKLHDVHGGKILLLEHQEHGLYVKLREAGARAVGVPVAALDRYSLAMLVLNVMAANDISGDPQTVLAVCRDMMCSRTPRSRSLRAGNPA
jgi:hypothetical protein